MGYRRTTRVGVAGAATVLLWGLVGVAVAPTAGAATTVNCPAGNLQAAINAAPAGSTINVSGTCTGNFVVNKNLRLVGPATLDGASNGTVIETDAANVRLLNLTIQNGQGEDGGGIANSGGLTLAR